MDAAHSGDATNQQLELRLLEVHLARAQMSKIEMRYICMQNCSRRLSEKLGFWKPLAAPQREAIFQKPARGAVNPH